MNNEEFSPSADLKIDKPGGEGGTSGIESADFDALNAEASGKTVKIDQPGGEGGTAG
jgi:hypothetical protein